jgi:hypothetical protein
MAGSNLYDNIWFRRGISLIWDGATFSQICPPKSVISLRKFLSLHKQGWPPDQLNLLEDERLVIAGLESAIDALPPDDSTNWLHSVVYEAIVSFQREVAGGGNEAALVFWITENKRLTYQTSEDIYYWHCTTEFKGQRIPLSKCLFNGAQYDLRRIHALDPQKKEEWIGLYHPRIS